MVRKEIMVANGDFGAIQIWILLKSQAVDYGEISVFRHTRGTNQSNH